MSKVFYQLGSQGGVPSPCPLATYSSLQLHLVALSGGKTHGRQTGLAVSAPSCAAIHRRRVLHKGWERSCTSWSLPPERALAAAGGTHEHPCLGGPLCCTALADRRAVLSPSQLAGRALWARRAAPQSHCVFFFQNKDLHSQIKSSFFYSMPLRSFLPFAEQHR